jgi:exosome complex component RRP41
VRWPVTADLELRVLQVLQADGGTRCACINAACMALANAGIPMRDMVAGCAVGYLQSSPLLDLNYQEDAGERQPGRPPAVAAFAAPHA